MAFAPPPPPPSRHQRTKVTPTKPKPVVQQAQIIPPKELPQEKPPELLAEAGDDEADEGGVEGGAPGGIRGGVISGVPGGVPGDIGKRLEFDENQMAKPAVPPGQPIRYTDQAIEHEVEGTLVVKCVLAVDGAVSDCRVLRGLPFMDRAIARFMATNAPMAPASTSAICQPYQRSSRSCATCAGGPPATSAAYARGTRQSAAKAAQGPKIRAPIFIDTGMIPEGALRPQFVLSLGGGHRQPRLHHPPGPQGDQRLSPGGLRPA